ncbi:TetR/AcrR family transcriptional regulator [Leifsonia naganoensis]|uniref:AcrR family transcriptional regulator n=1 Tax=Leifsonia naganoensis TaxID=150025 RepID=A0A853DPY6_9MICO|nr:TetR/AcrR family transcriptional regulator [Leifsonia naganoensis]NYK10588.1 AcrR family transcriptional regulator [Leifsonia naganoensis]
MAQAGATSGGRRAPLTRQRIVEAGMTLAAGADASAISVRSIGAALGVDPTAAYRHFPSKQALMEALLDEVLARALVRADPAGDWRDRLHSLAVGTLEAFTLYPAIAVEATVLTTNGPAETETVEFILAAFAEAGLDGSAMVRHYALFSSFVLSGAAGIAHARVGEGGSGSGKEGARWLERPLRVDPAEHPHIAASATELVALRDDEIFLFGVESILDSAERNATR